MNTPAEGLRIYNLFPLLAGPIAEWGPHLDRIAAMGFNWVYVNPIQEPGASGSLYAIKDYYSVHPALAGKKKASAESVIKNMTKAANDRGLKVMMDLVINHTGIDSVLTKQHPEWYERNRNGSLFQPYCVDPDTHKKTVWKDLAAIDFRKRPERQEIIDYFRDLVAFYIKLGVEGFRCDAAYKVPADVWRALTDAGRNADRRAIFVAENLGAMEEEVEALGPAGFDALFNSSKWWNFRDPWLLKQYDLFRTIAPSVSFPESHDTPRLAAELKGRGIIGKKDVEQAYRRAYLFAAVFASGIMIPMGYEYGFRKPLHVVKSKPGDWEKPAFDLTGYISEVNAMRAAIPEYNTEGPQYCWSIGGGRVMALIRRSETRPNWALSLINPDERGKAKARFDGIDGAGADEITPGGTGGRLELGDEIKLDPGEIRVFVGR